MKLGVKKVGGTSFEEAETRAKAEAERIATIGAEAAEQERLEKVAAAERAAQRAAEQENARSQPQAAPTLVNYYQANAAGSTTAKENDDGLARLGMGMGRMGFGAVPSKSPSSNYTAKQGKEGFLGPVPCSFSHSTWYDMLTHPHLGAPFFFVHLQWRYRLLVTSLAVKRRSHPISTLVAAIMIRKRRLKQMSASRRSQERLLSAATSILVAVNRSLGIRRRISLIPTFRPLETPC